MAESRQHADGRRARRKIRIALLVFAVLASFVAVQTAAAFSTHSDHEGGAGDHCCPVCHSAHYPVLHTSISIQFAGLAVTGWRQLIEDEIPIGRERHAVNSSRAPPV